MDDSPSSSQPSVSWSSVPAQTLSLELSQQQAGSPPPSPLCSPDTVDVRASQGSVAKKSSVGTQAREGLHASMVLPGKPPASPQAEVQSSCSPALLPLAAITSQSCLVSSPAHDSPGLSPQLLGENAPSHLYLPVHSESHRSSLNATDNWAQEDPRETASHCSSPDSIMGRQQSKSPNHNWDSDPGSASWGMSPSQCAARPPTALKPVASTPGALPAFTHLPPPEVALLALKGHPELQALLSLLPSKQDMHTLASELKTAWRQDLQTVQTEVDVLQTRVQKLEEIQTTMQQELDAAKSSSATGESLHCSLISQLDDLENRNRRNNIRLRGIPESVQTQDLIPSLTKLFNTILGREPETTIAFDRAHRALRPQSSDPTRPRDVICRIHLYSLKDDIMRKARMLPDLTIQASKIALFPDLSRRTLRLRAATKPLLAVLQARKIPYRWGFPFALHAHLQDRSAILRTPVDLPSFLKTFDLPDISLPDWDAAFFNVFSPADDTGGPAPRKHPLAMTPRQQRTRRRLGHTPFKDAGT